jgi:hypothetical protein
MKLKEKNIFLLPKGCNLFLLVWFVLFSYGCTDQASDKSSFTGQYFDIPEYFNEEAERLNNSHAGLRKILTNGLDEDEVKKDSVDWYKEFIPFIDIDINKPSFKNGYITDTIGSSNDYEITYHAIDSTFEIKSVYLKFVNNRIVELHVTHRKNNFYYISQEELRYNSDIGYSIHVDNELMAGKSFKFKIIGEIINKIH